MEESLKLCLHCAKKITGRTDKKFCNNYCRSSFHNETFAERNHYIRQINGSLQKNRTILANAYKSKGSLQLIPFQELYLKGFNPAVFTHMQTDKKGARFIFCYDYGYKTFGNDKIKILQNPNT